MPEPNLPTDALLEDLEARFAARRAAAAAPPEPEQPYLHAAAVLDVFDPTRLRPAGQALGPLDLDMLLRCSIPAIGWRHAGLRTLRLEVRRPALRALGSRAAMRAALKANSERVLTGVQRQFERWLDDEDFAVERMTYVELEDLSQLYEWGLDDLTKLPSRDRVERALVQRSAVAVFEHLVDRDFVGRAGELKILEEQVALKTASQRGPLVISGPGGTGKTALIGRFLIRHVEDARNDWFPFAYLPFDSETLDIREPFTLLLAAAAQFGAQAEPLAKSKALITRQLRIWNEVVVGYRDYRGSLQRRANVFTDRGDRIASLSGAESDLYDVFADLLVAVADSDPAGTGATPVVLVFDTFEEVVYRAEEDLLGFWSMLDYLQHRVPPLRVVLAGRSRVNVPSVLPPPTELVLDDLIPDDAVRLLKRLGIDDPAVAQTIARQIGGNPLSLRLAARVASEERPGPGGLLGLSVQNIGAELVRGQLYRRLLDHIHDDDVRALAHPGMVLRWVTPTIIENVLAPSCDIENVDYPRARELFDELRREQVLVSLEGDGSLRYREEVRRPVLELLKRDLPAQVRRIHRYAVAHYQLSDAPVDRAEELYHRLMLRQAAHELDFRWLPGVEQYLASAADELPPEQRRWLSSKMSIKLPPEIYQLADVSEWERLAGRRATELIRFSGPEATLNLLHERTERTPESPLFAIEARALLDLKQPARAAVLLDEAVAGFPTLGNPGRLAEILWLRAQAAAAQGETGQFLAFLRRLAEITLPMRSTLAYAQTLTEMLGVLNPLDQADPDAPEVSTIRHTLSGALGRLTEAEVAQESSLVRLALVRLGPHYPALLADLADRTIFDLVYLARSGHADLTQAIGQVAESLAGQLPRLRDLTAGPVGPDTEALVEELVQNLARQSGPEATDPQLTPSLAEAVLTVLRSEEASLSGSSLAGLDDYREPWELETTREIAL